jgi:hypothetical protein
MGRCPVPPPRLASVHVFEDAARDRAARRVHPRLASVTGAGEVVREAALERPSLRTPRSAAYAGIVFSVLAFASLLAVRIALVDAPADARDWLIGSWRRDSLLTGLSLVPFAAVAFLWFVGVIRDRVGVREDRFFATIFLGSGLLFIAVLLVGEAMAAGMVLSVEPVQTFSVAPPDWWTATRDISRELIDVALQMAGAFTSATTILLWRTGVAPRWLTLLGGVVAALLLFAVFVSQWIGLLFPLWVLAVSVAILVLAGRGEEMASQV